MAITQDRTQQAASTAEPRRSMLRLAGAGIALLLCILATKAALGIGVSSWLIKSSGALGALTRAVNLSPHDAGGYQARAAASIRRGEFGPAVDDLRQAISLRPGDYHLWIELSVALDRAGKVDEALAAATEAERLAPAYTTTHWELGKRLIGVGRRDQAFEEFRRASLNRPDLFSETLDKAWLAYEGDCAAIQNAVGNRNDRERLIMTRFFITKDKPAEAMAVIRQIENLSKDNRRSLVADLLRTRRFAEAYSLWITEPSGVSINQSLPTINDASFEKDEIRDDGGFGWQADRPRDAKVSIDRHENHTGVASVRIDWAGNPAPSDQIISQLVIVEPNTHYSLSFWVRSENLISGGASRVDITDVTQNDEQTLGQSDRLPVRTSIWESRNVEFTTGKFTRAVRLALRRENCEQSSCPIFGSLWLDDFSLQRSARRRLTPDKPKTAAESGR